MFFEVFPCNVFVGSKLHVLWRAADSGHDQGEHGRGAAQPQGVTFRVENRMLYVDFGDAHPKRVTINVYSLDGRRLLTRSGRDRISLSGLKDGVYAVQVITDQRATTGSTLIRL